MNRCPTLEQRQLQLLLLFSNIGNGTDGTYDVPTSLRHVPTLSRHKVITIRTRCENNSVYYIIILSIIGVIYHIGARRHIHFFAVAVAASDRSLYFSSIAPNTIFTPYAPASVLRLELVRTSSLFCPFWIICSVSLHPSSASLTALFSRWICVFCKSS